jgi:protein required for attachment to host cells
MNGAKTSHGLLTFMVHIKYKEKIMPNRVTWIFIADAGNGRIIDRTGKMGSFSEVRVLSHPHESTHEHGADRPGRGFESAGDTRHAYEPRTDWHENQKDAFAKELVAILDEAHNLKKFDELYILAPAKMLGYIRDHITRSSNHMATKVTKELSKDAVNFTMDELKKCLDKS